MQKTSPMSCKDFDEEEQTTPIEERGSSSGFKDETPPWVHLNTYVEQIGITKIPSWFQSCLHRYENA